MGTGIAQPTNLSLILFDLFSVVKSLEKLEHVKSSRWFSCSETESLLDEKSLGDCDGLANVEGGHKTVIVEDEERVEEQSSRLRPVDDIAHEWSGEVARQICVIGV
ncbi:hypothetical protein Tco_1302908 [Tanacetum coccineum]